MRPGEAYRLDCDQVDLVAGELAVTSSKFAKSRVLPLHPTTVEALRDYRARRDLVARPGEVAMFLSRAGRRRVASAQAAATFRSLLVATAIEAPPGRRPPRLYDLRHSFAVHTLIDWHQAGVDVQARLPVLSAYLGHLVPANTYWYLEAAPELMAVVAGRLAASWEAGL